MTNTQDNDVGSEEDLFYFETDHLALRGNKDYSEVLKTLVLLCAQRKQAIKDYNTAAHLKKEALEDPGKILEKVVKGESLGMPDLQTLPELPTIDWSKYNVKIPEDAFNFVYSDFNVIKKKQQTPKKNSKSSRQKWTAEEQKRLEELLQIYPPEPFENRRFKKIADALGNRTFQQVSSRVQKYFLKLYKAGLPIPGRIPKSAEKYKKNTQHKHQRHNHYLQKPTTFFPELCVPVVMNESESVPGPSTKVPIDSIESPSSSNYLIPSTYHDGGTDVLPPKNEKELQLVLLRKIRKIKMKDEDDPNAFNHIGFKCDYCGDEPIVGTRWHCSVCTSISVDFCTDCAVTQLYSENCHPLKHNLVAYCDTETPYPSDSESVNGIKQEMSDSSDSDFDDEEMSGEETNENGAGCSTEENLNDRIDFNDVNDISFDDLQSYL